jgi:hypothetical protein
VFQCHGCQAGLKADVKDFDDFRLEVQASRTQEEWTEKREARLNRVRQYVAANPFATLKQIADI